MKPITDTDRLDFLERSAPLLDDSCRGWVKTHLEIKGRIYRGKTIRKTVDMAMRAERRKK